MFGCSGSTEPAPSRPAARGFDRLQNLPTVELRVAINPGLGPVLHMPFRRTVPR